MFSLQKQVDCSHYFNDHYLNLDRFVGLHSQIFFIRTLKEPNKILEIGIGPGLFSSLMKTLNYNIKNIDLAFDLQPNIVGQIPFLPLSDKSFDTVCAFEILEHIPFHFFSDCIKEMARIAKKYIVFSVPDQRHIYNYKISLEIKMMAKRKNITIFKKKTNKITNPIEHYWEIGHKEVNEDLILNILNGFSFSKITNYFIDPYFNFFIIII